MHYSRVFYSQSYVGTSSTYVGREYGNIATWDN